ncbi:DUF664 domain-containing protein [candidate division KSB3 bacterium]|uniref:DUF664 domain-containing protein n=1 Tax=candidate division KSB3 bacterium TaxID=2044937 RepID=A0A9D5JSN8_9BACT|nr:DUF664 domain-containing protein [candidate division KSB3 bacterium]MBD3323495.1 DUF664 domain-containing protein [candidate division KSB3 bacterium]
MTNLAPKSGRSRQYAVTPAAAFAHQDAAYLGAALDELSHRLFDLIEDLGPTVLEAVPANATHSIATLTVHLADAEAIWLSRIPESTDALELRTILKQSQQNCPTRAPELITLCQRIRAKITIPSLVGRVEIDTPVVQHDKVKSVRQVLLHQLWHWTYHTGQIGLLRRMFGPRYQWNF